MLDNPKGMLSNSEAFKTPRKPKGMLNKSEAFKTTKLLETAVLATTLLALEIASL